MSYFTDLKKVYMLTIIKITIGIYTFSHNFYEDTFYKVSSVILLIQDIIFIKNKFIKIISLYFYKVCLWIYYFFKFNSLVIVELILLNDVIKYICQLI